jgi:hypothetical protein
VALKNLELKVLFKTIWASNFITYGYIVFLLLWKLEAASTFDPSYVGSVYHIFDGVMLTIFILLCGVTLLYCLGLWHAHRIGELHKNMMELLEEEDKSPQ